MSGESTCNRSPLMLMDQNNNTIHVIYFVLLSTNSNEAVEYEATMIAILLNCLATNGLLAAVAVHLQRLECGQLPFCEKKMIKFPAQRSYLMLI